MAIRKILVPIDGSEAARPALETAFAVGLRLGAHVHALHVRIDPAAAVPLVGEGMSGALIQDLMELTEREAAARAAAAQAMFNSVSTAAGCPLRDRPHSEGASAWFEERRGREEDEVVRAGRLADLVVVGRTRPEPETRVVEAFGAAIFETGGPVLVAGSTPPGSLNGRIAIAWNDSVEAARAIKYAMPFLTRASAVDVIAVGDDEHNQGPDLVVDYLAWQGVPAAKRLVADRGAAGEALVEACENADLVVMGAYTRSRLWQLILGSVTRHMIEETGLRLLMAH